MLNLLGNKELVKQSCNIIPVKIIRKINCLYQEHLGSTHNYIDYFHYNYFFSDFKANLHVNIAFVQALHTRALHLICLVD